MTEIKLFWFFFALTPMKVNALYKQSTEMYAVICSASSQETKRKIYYFRLDGFGRNKFIVSFPRSQEYSTLISFADGQIKMF